MRFAESVEEAVEQLKEAQEYFVNAMCVLSIEQADGRIAACQRVEGLRNAWGMFEKRCMQLSQWIEHGRGVTEEMKPELVKTLFAAEKILLDNKQYGGK